MAQLRLPIGVDDFNEIVTSDYYYVDKTWFIKELIDKKGKVNLFTRPRRFGKTLNLSMLRYYFEMPEAGKDNRPLFESLKIMQAGERYTKEMGQYPVIMLTLKSAKQGNFSDALYMLKKQISEEFKRHRYVLSSDAIIEDEKVLYEQLMTRSAPHGAFLDAILFLSKCLYQYHHQQVIILMDEYDVPLESSYFGGFYEDMVNFIRSIFESSLKTNPYLAFAVITGCLRISKESIFTGLNNLEVISIMNENYGEYFGFTTAEVQDMLAFYEREESMDTMKEWYDGYLFGGKEVYNPWSVINYVKRLVTNPQAYPVDAWSNTSSNSIVRELVEGADSETRADIEGMIDDGTIEVEIHEDITYSDIHETQDNLWNFLFFTGYLKAVSQRFEGRKIFVKMMIPNEKVKYVYENTILLWFDRQLKGVDFTPLRNAIEQGDCQAFTDFVSDQLMQTISFFDYAENYYHGFLTGLLKGIKSYRVESNRESGNGRPDLIMRENKFRGKSVIIEIKVARKFADMHAGCQDALRQIEDGKYDYIVLEDGYQIPQKFGVCFFKKGCLVEKEISGKDLK